MIPPEEYERVLMHLRTDAKRMRAILAEIEKEIQILENDFYRNR
jgi:hypothetical protein